MIQPLNNHCLVEVIDEYEGIVGSDKAANVQKGYLRDATLVSDHLTASVGYEIQGIEEYVEILEAFIDKIVYWQEYADVGSKFEIEGKQYVLIPFYRLIGVEKEGKK
jgi:hypothetical protein